MNQYSIKLDNTKLDILQKIYQNFLLNKETYMHEEDIIFKANHQKTEIVAKTDGSVLFDGYFISDEIRQIINGLNLENIKHVGVGYFGLNDIFGPICACSVLIDNDKLELIKNLNILGKHSISEIIKLAPVIAKNVDFTLEVVEPNEFNSLNKSGISNNKLISILINTSILKLTSKYDTLYPVICENILEHNAYINYLKEEKFIHYDVSFDDMAYEKHLAVAAAKIICQYEYLAKLSKYKKMFSINLIPGSSSRAVDCFKEIYSDEQRNIDTILENVSKLNNKKIYRLIKRD